MAEQRGEISALGALPKTVPPVLVPDHELVRLIGKGSYGEVWLARNALGACRAVKIVFENSFRHRKPFEREFNGVKKFEPISRLHDGLMDVLQIGRNEAAGYFYCVMELADDVRTGQDIDPDNYSPRTLTQEVGEPKQLPIPVCRRIGTTIASTLDFLHACGLIHRDVKPSNIIFVNGAPKLADIGLVAEMSEARSYVGTEGFIPPEGPGTVQADIYSLGKVLYEISTGKDRYDYPELPATTGDSDLAPELLELNRIILRACRADPRQRYKTAGAMAEDIAALEPERTRRRAKRLLVAITKVSVGLAIVAGAGWWTLSRAQMRSRPADFPPGLVSWWGGERSTADAVGGNDGTIAGGGQVDYAPGVIGKAFVFDGIHRDRVDVGAATNLQLQNFTIEAWIKRDNPTNVSLDDLGADGSRSGQGGIIFGYGTSGYCLAALDDGRLILSRVDMEGIFSTKTVSDTNWHHVAVTKAGSKAAFYLDGLPASDELKYEATFYFDSPAAIGSRGDGRGGTFWGMIDELAIYRRPLSATEIQTIYKANVAAIYLPEFRPFVPPASGLVNWWPGDGDVRDICGRTNGILMNGTKFAAGKVGKAFRFDGRTQCVKFPRTASLDVGEQLSIACWMKADPDNFMSNIQGLVITDFYGISISSGFDFTKYGVNFGLNTDPTKLLSSETCPTTADANEGAAVVTPGQWHHIAGTYDGCRLQLYVDGRPWGKPVKHSGRISPMTTNSFLTIGSEDGKGIPGYKARYFKGLIDEVCIYNRALTADEIEYFYKAGCAGIPVFQNIR